ncbi:MAG TPA: hypothetical protein PLB02_11540 [Thermoanaerobaculia bacterium]|nr:hypothetical protein [Thermoanaerobaculia bacterium]HQR68020.1 hypothetical protein [Thermoanaerobaculia bacterium]
MNLTPAQTLIAYVRAFETLRAENVVPFYLLPCTFIRPDGVWVVQDPETALALVEHLIEHARAQRYCRTEVSGLTIRPLAATLVELSGVFVRYDDQSSETGRFGFTYLLRADSEAWRIVVAAAHDPPAQATPPSP